MKKYLLAFWIASQTTLVMTALGIVAEPIKPSVQQQPYAVELPTNGESEAERRQDFVKALTTLLTKNSNNPKMLELAGVKAALGNPGRYVRRFNYVNRSTMMGKQEQFIQISFDPKGIAKLLQLQRSSSNVVLVETKPTTLVWLAVDKSGGKVLDESSDDGMIEVLKKKGQEFGLSIMLPTLDLQDISNVKVQDICRLDVEKIKAVSQRYGSSVIAMGCVSGPSFLKSDWSSKWLLLQGAKIDNFTFIGSSADDVITQAIKGIAANTANIVTPVAIGPVAKVVLRITNIDGLRQYNEVVKYLHNLGKIPQIDLVNISVSDVEVAINIPGGKKALLIVLGAQHKLAPNEEVTVLSPGIDLNYKWVVDETTNT